MISTTELLIPPRTGTPLQVLQDSMRPLATGEDSNGSFEVFELTGPVNSGPPPHRHPWAEHYFILEGEVEISVGQNQSIAAPGYFVRIPGNTVHTYRIASPTARFLVITSGTEAGEFFTDLDREIDPQALSMEKVIDIATRHQVIPVVPA